MAKNLQQQELNEFLYSVVNQFSILEFEQYTNFAEVINTLAKRKCSKKQVKNCIEQNFKENISNKKWWMAGYFASLKLSDHFYQSNCAAHIFEDLYGITQCQVNLGTHQATASPFIGQKICSLPDKKHDMLSHLMSSGKKKKPKLPTKYPRKTMRIFPNAKQVLGTISKEINPFPSQSSGRAEANVSWDSGVEQTRPQIRESIRPRDVKDWSHHKEDREPVPMTFIPFENIARYMDKSDIETNFRQSFYDYLKLLESEFEKYIAETDLNRMSLNNFFHAYLGAQTQTKIRLGKEDVKSDFGFVCVPGKVGPGNGFTAYLNNHINIQTLENGKESRKIPAGISSKDNASGPSSSQVEKKYRTADEKEKLKRPSSNGRLAVVPPEKRRRLRHRSA